MSSAVKIKPITATVIINEEKYIKEIKESLYTKPTEASRNKNTYALSLLKKARRG
jgi:hypothetical protein